MALQDRWQAEDITCEEAWDWCEEADWEEVNWADWEFWEELLECEQV